MPQVRRAHGTPLGASLTRPDEPERESVLEKLNRFRVARSVLAANASIQLRQAVPGLSDDDHFKILGVVTNLFDHEYEPWRVAEREQREAERRTKMHCVYFIRHGQHVKIGVTQMGSTGRFKSMQLPPGAKVVAEIPNAEYAHEAELHRRFAASRVHGEWFASTPELESLIATFAI